MGCDIHMHTEVKVNGQWYCYGSPSVDRYLLFALMAGVRNNWDLKPISEPKGMPDDASIVVKLSRKAYGSDGHSDSYLTAAEISELADRWPEACKEHHGSYDHNDDLEWNFFGYLDGNSWGGFTKYPDDRPKWVEDVRFVFWFDN